jgi:hypothetical protein
VIADGTTLCGSAARSQCGTFSDPISMTREFNQRAPRWVHRLDTDDQTVPALAAEIISLGICMSHQPSG